MRGGSATAFRRDLTPLLPALLLFALAYVLPLGMLLVNSLTDARGFTLFAYRELFSSPVFFTIVWRTVRLAMMVTAICVAIGYPMAYGMARLPRRSIGLVLAVVTIPYLSSVVIRAYAWVVILGNNGVINRLLMSFGWIDEPLTLVFNDIGTYNGMVHVQLPLMIFPIYASLRRIDRSLPIAAQGLASSPAGAFLRIVLPLSLPGVWAGTILVFLSCLGFYVTPALLGGPGAYMLAEAIQVRVSLLADFQAAAAQASLLMLLVVIVVIMARKAVARAVGGADDGTAHGGRGAVDAYGLKRPLLPAGISNESFARWLGSGLSHIHRPLLWGVVIAGLLFLIGPMLVVVPMAFSSAAYLTFPPPGYSLRWFEAFFSNWRWLSATGFSLSVAGISALAALAIGAAAAFGLGRSSLPGRSALYLLMISPMIVPTMVYAAALYLQLAGLGQASNPASFVIAYTVLAVPYTLVVVTAGLRGFDRSLEAASLSLGATPFRTFRAIVLPIMLPAFLSAYGFAFLSAFDDLVVALFFSTPTATTLPMRMWEDIRNEISPMISVVATLLLAITALILLGAKQFQRDSAS